MIHKEMSISNLMVDHPLGDSRHISVHRKQHEAALEISSRHTPICLEAASTHRAANMSCLGRKFMALSGEVSRSGYHGIEPADRIS
jgi:hypothetical protein